jgi:1,4-dihydroxy-2-naphthoate octaprenyltransferase
MSKSKIWIKAARLRTLPLAFATIILGSFIAHFFDKHNWFITVLALVTTLFLQILSNFANDYGDTQHGADSEDREGPKRAVQQGLITPVQMKNAMILFSGLSLVAGMSLIHISFDFLSGLYLLFAFLLLITIYASINYTSGKSPYGYKALGDISVFIFFGVFGVALSAFLHTKTWNWTVLLPAAAVGMLATAVLNLNNMRDAVSDTKAGKNTVAIILGFKKSKIYQLILLVLPFVLSVLFVLMNKSNTSSLFSYLFLLVFIAFIPQVKAILQIQNHQEYDKWLKPTAILTLVYCIVFGISISL